MPKDVEKTAKEQLAELQTSYKASMKLLNKQVKGEEAKELEGVFQTTLDGAVDALRNSITEGLGSYHRTLKGVVVRVSYDGKGVLTLKNSIRTLRMSAADATAWDAAHVERDREVVALEMEAALVEGTQSLLEYNEETVRLKAAEPQEPAPAVPEVEPVTAA